MSFKLDTASLERDVRAATRKLEGFSNRVRKKTLRTAAREGSREFRDQARRLAPRQNGYLKRSLTNKIKTYPTAVVGMVGQDIRKLKKGATKARKRAKLGGISGRGETVPSHLVERPTKPHRIAGPLVWTNRGRRKAGRQVQFAAVVRHPGTRGNPFLSRAEFRGRRKAQARFRARLVAEVGKL